MTKLEFLNLMRERNEAAKEHKAIQNRLFKLDPVRDAELVHMLRVAAAGLRRYIDYCWSVYLRTDLSTVL